jgi:hypothetical protein
MIIIFLLLIYYLIRIYKKILDKKNLENYENNTKNQDEDDDFLYVEEY